MASNSVLSPDIQTGRNVYADQDLYLTDLEYKAKIDSYTKEGFRLVFGSPEDPESGGGSSDFSLATVTITNSLESDCYCEMICIDNDIMITGVNLDPNAVTAITAVLYKGGCFCRVLDVNDEPIASEDIETTGSITADEFGYYITGDCTITIS